VTYARIEQDIEFVRRMALTAARRCPGTTAGQPSSGCEHQRSDELPHAPIMTLTESPGVRTEDRHLPAQFPGPGEGATGALSQCVVSIAYGLVGDTGGPFRHSSGWSWEGRANHRPRTLTVGLAFTRTCSLASAMRHEVCCTSIVIQETPTESGRSSNTLWLPDRLVITAMRWPDRSKPCTSAAPTRRQVLPLFAAFTPKPPAAYCSTKTFKCRVWHGGGGCPNPASDDETCFVAVDWVGAIDVVHPANVTAMTAPIAMARTPPLTS